MTIIGKMRHRITIQSLTVTQDQAGGTVENWSNFETVWAQIEPLSGREFVEAQQFNSEVQGKIKIRFLTGIRPDMRIVFGSKILHILTPLLPNEIKKEIEILYKEALD